MVSKLFPNPSNVENVVYALVGASSGHNLGYFGNMDDNNDYRNQGN